MKTSELDTWQAINFLKPLVDGPRSNHMMRKEMSIVPISIIFPWLNDICFQHAHFSDCEAWVSKTCLILGSAGLFLKDELT